MSIQTLEYSETLGIQNMPKLLLSINSRPPIWATSYQILFSKNLTKSKLLYWVSDATGKDSEFAYIGIDSLKTLFLDYNPSSPISYSFSTNDRIRFIKNLTSGINTIYINKDFEILDELNNPIIMGFAYTGKVLKIKLPSTDVNFDFGLGFFHYFIELYTPAQSVANGLDVYYEVGERYGIGNVGTDQAFHQGMLQNQTSDLVTPATFEFTKGDDYYRLRTIYVSKFGISDNFTLGVIDQNFSDYFPSAVNSYGRPWVVNENAKQTYSPTLIRFGGEYQQDTSISQINRFYFDNQDNYDRSNGDIKKLFIEGRRLYVFQKFDIGVVPILTQIVRDTTGNPLEANSDILLNKIAYPYSGKIGIGDIPESFAFGKYAMYGCDNNKGIVWRLSQNGIEKLSVLYKTNSFFIQKLSGFKNELNIIIPETGTPTVYGVFDAYTNKYIICMEAINRTELIQEASTIVFLEANQQLIGFESRYSLYPENIGCLDNLLISFKDGQVWTHNSDKFCNFFSIQYDAFIKVVFNDNPISKKTFISITETSNEIWECPEIETQTTSYGETNQESNLIIDDFEKLENVYHAAFLRDSNSIGGVIDGDSLKGQYIIVKLQINDAQNFVFLNTATIKYIDSPLNNK